MLKKSCMSCFKINKLIQVLQVRLGGFWQYFSEPSSEFLIWSGKNFPVPHVNEMH